MSNILPINVAYNKNELEIDKIDFDDLSQIDEYIKKNNKVFDEYADILLKDIFSDDDNENKQNNTNNKCSVLKAV